MRSWAVWSIMTIWCIGNLESLPDNTSPTRLKRIVNGVPLPPLYHYEASSWYVYLADGHECNPRNFWPHHCAKHENLRCGGTLLTPSIVQTSCECLAAFIGPRQGNFTSACILDKWEKMHLAFVGAIEVETMIEGYMSHSFYIHSKCAKLAVDPQYLTTHDYGFVKLTRDVSNIGRKFIMKYAPIYSMQSLGKMWTYNTNNGVVCLTLGYGYFKSDEKGVPIPEKSSVIRHSWVLIYEYVTCYYLTRVNDETFNYLEMATWSCMTRMPNDREKSFLAQGDLGSPVSCNNEYFGIANQHIHFLGQDMVLQFAAGIAFNPYENAIEFRAHFAQNLEFAIQVPNFRPSFATMFPMMDKGRIRNHASDFDTRFHLCTTALFVIINSLS